MDTQEESSTLTAAEHNMKTSSHSVRYHEIHQPSSPLVPLDMSLGKESGGLAVENDCQMENSRLLLNKDKSSGDHIVQKTAVHPRTDPVNLIQDPGDASPKVACTSENNSKKKAGRWRNRASCRKRIGRIPKRHTRNKSTNVSTSESTHSLNSKKKEMENSLKASIEANGLPT